MSWTLQYLPEAEKDLRQFGADQQLLVQKAIRKVRANPLPVNEGSYGKPLGRKGNLNLMGLLKIKLKNAGIRVVYKLIRTETEMLVVVVGARADGEVNEMAQHRLEKHNL